MKFNFLSIGLILFLLLGSKMGLATHNRAGEITYVQTGDLTITATITTYTKASSEQADRDTLLLDWGDGTASLAGRINGPNQKGEILPGDLKFNIYVAHHTYPGRSTYTLSTRDPNRIGNILNINNGNSISVQFYLETTLTFLNPQFQGFNNSAILSQPPIDDACIGERFIHSPNAFDIDRDSLAFELITPFEDMSSGVPNYLLPSAISPGPNNQISFDTKTGEFIWESPQLVGEYNIAFRINEYRNGLLISSIVRDMQITVRACDNNPPEVTTDDEICVVAHEVIDITVEVDDSDLGQQVRLEANGGPLQVTPQPAQFMTSPGYQDIPLSGRFIWNTQCEHISKSDYSVVFKGEDNYFISSNDTTGLVDLHTLNIHVSGPAPQNLNAQSENQTVRLTWDSPYSCENTENQYFRGFTIWRVELPTPIILDTCGTDLRDYGYSPIKFQVSSIDYNKYFYDDADVERGITYCYRVTAEFARLSQGQNPFNRVQSLPSNEVCLQVNRDIPLITHVSVEETHTNTGEILIRWVPPIAEDLDTAAHPGPYRYRLLRSPGIGTTNFTAVQGAEFTVPNFVALTAITSFLDENIDTESSGYTYAIDFYIQDLNQVFVQSQSASSVFLSLVGSDRRMELKWEYIVPWFVNDHEIYRQNLITGVFESITNTPALNYEDLLLENGQSYCYFVKSIGSYGIQDIVSPLENFSQIACAVPTDSIPPCIPLMTISNNCEETADNPITELVNTISWQFNQLDCRDSSDILSTEIYFISETSSDTILLVSIDDNQIRTFTHTLGLDDVGCYFMRTIDVNGNVSLFTDIQCSEICPDYELPNAFTPNGDGSNDLFTPYPYRFITRVDMKIFTRWGNLVFETTDPNINWDGKDLNGNDVNEDVYYYTIDVYSGGTLTPLVRQKSLQGFITLVRE